MKNCLILGCGRSGTSLLAGMLRANGYFMGDDYVPRTEANPKGFFEDREVNAINDAIILSHLEQSVIYRLKRWLGYGGHPGVHWLKRIRSPINGCVESAIESRIKERLVQRPFCYKDPRFSYTLPVWRRFCSEDTCYLVVFRDPVRTAKSILRFKSERLYHKTMRLTYEDAGDVWYCVYTRIIGDMENTDKYLFVHYDDLVAGHGISCIEEFVEGQVDKSFADGTISRSTDSGDGEMPQRWRQLYSELMALSRQMAN